MQGFREVLGNKSARACLANSLLGAIWLAAPVFAFAFYADVFLVPPSMRGIVSMITLLALVPGILIGGVLVNPVGRKRLFMTSAFSAVVVAVFSYVLMLFIPNFWLSVGIRCVSSFLGGFVFAAGPNLYVEQVPKYRGTMLSLTHGLNGIGVAIGVFIGGAALTYFGNTAQGYAIAISTLGVLGLTGTLSIFLFAKDPCKNQQIQDVQQIQNL